MREKPASCAGCACELHGTDFSAVEGTGASGVMLVGEASGEMEARDGLPFRPYAPAGSVLQRTFQRMGLSREQFSTTNILRCRPRNNWLEGAPWEYGAVAHCRPNLDQAIAERRPRAIVALGGAATRELTGMAGSAQGVTHLAGYVLPYSRKVYSWGEKGAADSLTDTIPVIPNFHPSYLRRGKASHQGVFARILQRAVNIAKGIDHAWRWDVRPGGTRQTCDACIPFGDETPDPNCPVCNGVGYVWVGGGEESDALALGYHTRPTAADIESFTHHVVNNPQLVVSYDLETDESASLDEDAREGFADTHIRLVQFAVEGGGAIAIPWEPGTIPAITRILHSPNPKCGHNVWLFDNKVLKAAGAREGCEVTPRGIVHDTLAMFHHWQPDLPAHLQFAASFVQFPFPWKHLAGSAIEFYGCCDVDATLRLFFMLRSTMIRDGIWDDREAQCRG